MERLVSKEQRKEILKDLGVTKDDMKRFWKECIEVNHKVRALDNSGRTWKDLPESQMRKLPTLKEETLRKLAEAEATKENDALTEEIKWAKAEEPVAEAHNDDGYSNYEHELIRKIDSGELLTERELSSLVYEFEVETEEGSDHRWTREMTTIAEICGRTFEIYWMKGLTEMQENEFWDQPTEVKKVQTVDIVKKTEWVGIDSAKVSNVPQFEIEKSDLISKTELLKEIMEQYDLNYGEQLINPTEFFTLVDNFKPIFTEDKENCSAEQEDQYEDVEDDYEYDE